MAMDAKSASCRYQGSRPRRLGPPMGNPASMSLQVFGRRKGADQSPIAPWGVQLAGILQRQSRLRRSSAPDNATRVSRQLAANDYWHAAAQPWDATILSSAPAGIVARGSRPSLPRDNGARRRVRGVADLRGSTLTSRLVQHSRSLHRQHNSCFRAIPRLACD
jgi:hypothetical protein